MSSLMCVSEIDNHLKPRLLDASTAHNKTPSGPQHRHRLSSKRSGFFKDLFALTPKMRPMPPPRPASSYTADIGSLSDTLSRRNTARLYLSGQRSQYDIGGLPTDTELPLSLAIETAILRELLDVPCYNYDSSLRSKAVRRGIAVGRAASVLTVVLRGHLESRSLRDQPDQNATLGFTLTPKLLIVTEAGFVHQYSSEGHPDRLPEKTLRLHQGTIAIASDALSGKHWVLRIVRDARPAHKKESFSLSSLPPRLLSWSSISEGEAAELLLVFDESLQFKRWLITLRKEIEALGGLQYTPDSRGLDGELQRFGHTPSPGADDTSVVFPPKPFVFPAMMMQSRAESASTPSSPRSEKSPATSLCRDSTADSSLTSAVELDRLQESCVLDQSFSNGTRSSYDAPTPLDVISIHSLKLQDPTASNGISTTAIFSTGLGRRKPAPTALSVVNTSRKRSSSCSAASPSPQLDRTPTIPTDDLEALAGRFAPRIYTEIHTPIEAEKMGHWLDSVMKAREIANDDPVTPKQHVHCPSDTNLYIEPTDSQRSSSLPSSSDGDPRVQRNSYMLGTPKVDMSPGLGDSTAHQPTHPPPYKLTSQRSSPPEVTSFDSKLYNPQFLRHRSACKSLNLATLPLEPEGGAEHTSLGTRSQSRSPSKNGQRNSLSVITTHNKPATNGMNKAERSPAVNDTHIATCFGVVTPFETQATSIGGESLDFLTSAKKLDSPPISILQQAIELQAETVTLPRRQKVPTRQKSMPDILYRADGPFSPPPTAPLPALPAQCLAPGLLQVQHRRGKSASPRCSLSKIGSDRQRRRESTFARAHRLPLASDPVLPAEQKIARRLSASLELHAARPALTRAPATLAGTVSGYGDAVSPTTLSNLAAAISAVSHRPRTSRASSLPVAKVPESTISIMEIKGYPFPLLIRTGNN